MEYYEKAKKLMDLDAVDFIGGVPEEAVKGAEENLSVKFPESYKAFLSDFGGGDIGGEIIFGLSGDEYEDSAIVTQNERENGLPENLLIIGLWGNSLICLETGVMINGECPVVRLSDDYRIAEVLANSFGKFLYDYYNED